MIILFILASFILPTTFSQTSQEIDRSEATQEPTKSPELDNNNPQTWSADNMQQVDFTKVEPTTVAKADPELLRAHVTKSQAEGYFTNKVGASAYNPKNPNERILFTKAYPNYGFTNDDATLKGLENVQITKTGETSILQAGNVRIDYPQDQNPLALSVDEKGKLTADDPKWGKMGLRSGAFSQTEEGIKASPYSKSAFGITTHNKIEISTEYADISSFKNTPLLLSSTGTCPSLTDCMRLENVDGGEALEIRRHRASEITVDMNEKGIQDIRSVVVKPQIDAPKDNYFTYGSVDVKFPHIEYHVDRNGGLYFRDLVQYDGEGKVVMETDINPTTIENFELRTLTTFWQAPPFTASSCATETSCNTIRESGVFTTTTESGAFTSLPTTQKQAPLPNPHDGPLLGMYEPSSADLAYRKTVDMFKGVLGALGDIR